MGAAADRAKVLRAELDRVETAAKEERDAERQRKRDEQRQKDIADTDAFREEHYELAVGPHNDYVGVSTGWDGGIEVGIVEWMTHQTSASLTREEAIALAEGILKLVK